MEIELIKKIVLVVFAIISIPIVAVFIGFGYASWKLGKIKTEKQNVNLLSKEQYEEHFVGFKIIDVVVKNRKCFYFILKNEDVGESRSDVAARGPENLGQPDHQIVRITLNEDDSAEIVKSGLKGYEGSLHAEMNYPEEEIFVIDRSATCFQGKKGIQSSIPSKAKGGPLEGVVKKVKSIGNSPVIVATTNRDLMIRKESETWIRLTPEFEEEFSADEGFEDFDGFALDDIYACGGAGIFHFDGTVWKQVGPQAHLDAICCAPDGYVYVTCWIPTRATTYRGRGDKWEKIEDHHDKTFMSYAKPCLDIIWHDGMIWMSGESDSRVFKDGKVVQVADAPYGGRLSVRDGVLLSANYSAHWQEEGGDWRPLFDF